MEPITPTPLTIYAESTPNPSSMKFVANKMIVDNGATAQYLNKQDTQGSKLATKLFEFPFVKAVFVAANFITISKSDNVSWEDITLELRDFIRVYISEGNEIIAELPKATVAVDNTFTEKKEIFTEHKSPETETEVKIVEVLEQYIRPAVESDGGSIVFKKFENGIVTVQLRGACSGCPSSAITLKGGIENLLKRMISDVTEVVAESV